MRFPVRISLIALIVCAIVAVSAPAAQAGFGFEKFFAGNCGATFEECGKGAKEGSKAEAEVEGYRQAGGYTNFGVTDFIVNNFEPDPVGKPGFKVPQDSVKNFRFDAAPGVVTNPQTVTYCRQKDFSPEGAEVEPIHHLFLASKCPESSIIGENKVVTVVEFPEKSGNFVDAPLSGKVYNLEQPFGLGSEFGVALQVAEPAPGLKLFAHTLIDGNVEWASDYHDYYLIKNIPEGLIESRLVLKGRENEASQQTGFIRNPTACTESGPETTSAVSGESYKGATASRPYTALVGTTGCETENFNPGFLVTPETTLSDQPDGVAMEATVTHPKELSATDVSDLKTAEITLPEGLTMNPAGAKGLEGCTPEQIGIGTRHSVTCPSHSRIGTFTLEVPTLPPGQLQGPIWLGKPAGAPITGPPYTIYLDAESARYGLKVRLKGTVMPNLTTGQLTATFSENPQAPFNQATVQFYGGGSAPLANPLVCGTGSTHTSFLPFSGTGALLAATPFTTEGCASSPPPFSWSQSSESEPARAGASGNFTLGLARSDGQQYLGKIRTVLPPGLEGVIPSVTLCGEPQANAGTCTSASQIGTVAVAAGAGSEPFIFNGKVYLTGPYEGAPYGLSIVVPAVAGPFNLGNVIARARIEVDPHTAQVIATDEKVPSIVGGVPTRIKSLTFSINRPGFGVNPTNCGTLATVSTLTSTLGTVGAPLSTPFHVEGCNALAFKPSFSAFTGAKTSKANGASLEVKISQGAGQANINSVKTSLPFALPSRLTTLQKACLEATFAANPLSCPAGSNVGTATAVTPLLANPMTGPAYLVSHGGAAFPDLDLVLEGNGVRVILVGNTDIKKGITTTTFATTPDVPVSSFTLKLPTGPHSALAANGNLCTSKLVLPTSIVAQSGAQFKQNTVISVTGCPVRIVRRRVSGSTAILTVQAPEAGRVSAGGTGLRGVSQRLSRAATTTLRVPLSSGGRRRHRPFRTRVRVGFVPSKKGPHSTASVLVTFH